MQAFSPAGHECSGSSAERPMTNPGGFIFVAYGSRGDVAPLALLAARCRSPAVLVTHQTHQSWLLSAHGGAHPLHAVFVPSLPAATWQTCLTTAGTAAPALGIVGAAKRSAAGAEAGGAATAAEDGGIAEAEGTAATPAKAGQAAAAAAGGTAQPYLPLQSTQQPHDPSCADHSFHATWLAIHSAAAALPTARPLSTTASLPEAACFQQRMSMASHGPGGRVEVLASPTLVFNLFALEVWHIAEALGLPCAACHSYQVPYSCPTSFPRRFQAVHPTLYQQLQAVRRASADQPASMGRATHPDHINSVTSDQPQLLGWGEVHHWMWPLFTERWQGFRQWLGLAACPLHLPGSDRPAQHLPLATSLLYGFSELWVPRPSHWPASVRVCGFWWQPLPSLPSGSAAVEPELGHQLSTWLHTGFNEMGVQVAPGRQQWQLEAGQHEGQQPPCRAPLCVDLGSMPAMGLVPDPRWTLQVLQQALRSTGRTGVLLTASWPGWAAAALALGAHPLPTLLSPDPTPTLTPAPAQPPLLLDQRLLLWPGTIPHGPLLKRCAALLHHGGSGTTCAALHCGIPQIMCPFMFDQFYHAERAVHLGLTPPPLPRSLLLHPPGVSLAEAGGGAEVAKAALDDEAGGSTGKARGRATTESRQVVKDDAGRLDDSVLQLAGKRARRGTDKETELSSSRAAGNSEVAAEEVLRGTGGAAPFKSGDADGGNTSDTGQWPCAESLDIPGHATQAALSLRPRPPAPVEAQVALAALRVAAALHDALRPSRAEACLAFAQELQCEDGVATAVAALEALATAHSPTSPSSGGSSKLGSCG
ncbi:hypothetical protein V8C86DRAFT_2509173 [Haematococcus lacustris]